MKYGMYVGAALLAAAVGLTASTGQKTVKDKVYTKEQATRAAEQFEKFCAKCHIKEKVPEGKKPGPPLTGDEFLANWQDRTVAELLENIYTNMPNDGSTTLTKEETADLAALILQMNKYPDGAEPLKYDDSAKAITIVR
jgi:mono/diheme cytochrome c family protein